MKLRLHHQEIRFRLSKSDIAHLESNDQLQEVLRLSPQASWTYALRLDESEGHDKSHVALTESGRQLSVLLPLRPFRAWLASTEIEWIIHQAQPELTLLIEKDLKPNRS